MHVTDILTVDCEDWFHILEPRMQDPSEWGDLPDYVQANTLHLLDLFDRHQAQATFFILGWVAEQHPNLVKEIARRGHALGSHGYYHIPPEEMSEQDFRDDLVRSRSAIENASGTQVLGFRAPGFGVRRCSFSYLQVLQESGFVYDASTFPGVCPGRGQAGSTAQPYQPYPQNGGFWVVPVTAVRLLGIPVVFSGGGFLRHLPTWFARWSAKRVHALGHPVVYYLHPRDLDPGTPRIPASAWKRWRYYGGRQSMGSKLESILGRGRFVSVEQFLRHTEAHAHESS